MTIPTRSGGPVGVAVFWAGGAAPSGEFAPPLPEPDEGPGAAMVGAASVLGEEL